MASEVIGSAAALLTAASDVKAVLDAMGAGVGIISTDTGDDPERWAVAVVVGGENVAALMAWGDAIERGHEESGVLGSDDAARRVE